jgi:hypothetical protein
VHKFGAELDAHRELGVMNGENASTNALARFEHDDPEARLMKRTCGGESGNPGADHHDINAHSVHDFDCLLSIRVSEQPHHDDMRLQSPWLDCHQVSRG